MSTTILITCLLVIICILLAVLVRGKAKNEPVKSGENNAIAANNSMVKAAEVSEIVLAGSLGQKLTFTKPSELSDAKYMEVSVRGTGNVIQHAGQGAGDIYTLKQLGNIAGKELYTHPKARSLLHDYGGGNYSSTFWGPDGKIATHEGYQAFDVTKALGGVNPIMVTMVAMQGMAIVSGQYFLKQINNSMQKIGKDIQELKEIHESEKRGILVHCRKRLMEITQMQYCSAADIMEIRNIASDAGKILEEYKDRYYAAKTGAEKYWYSSGIVDKAIKEYNNRLYKMRYLLQVCMLADRIIDDAKLAEIVVRSKIDVNDPVIHSVYNQMEENYQNGFNAHIIEESDDITRFFINKGWGIINDSVMPHRNTYLIKQIEENMGGMQNDILNFTASVRRVEDNCGEAHNYALLLSDEEAPRFFVEIPEVKEATLESGLA